MKAKITKRSVDSAKVGPGDVFLWDTEIRGFGCKVTSTGVRVFILQYWSHGRARRVILGRYGSELTVDEARTKVRRLRGQIADGGDPASEIVKARNFGFLAYTIAMSKKPHRSAQIRTDPT